MSVNPTHSTRPIVSEIGPQGNSTCRAYQEIEQTVGAISNRTRLLLLALLVVIQFCLIINSSWRATPDSALYLGLGESLAEGRGYVFNGELHTFVPPGYPFLVAAARLLSTNNFLNYRILMAVLGLLTAIIGYIFIRRLCGPNTALLVGGLFGVNHVLLHNSTLTLSDAPFAFFTLLALTALLPAAQKKSPLAWTLVAGGLMGLLPLIRINGLGVPIAGAIFLFFSWKRMTLLRRFAYVLVFLLTAFGLNFVWQAYKATFPVSYSEGTYFDTVFGTQFQHHLWVMPRNLFRYVSETSYALTGLNIKTGILEFFAPLISVLGFFIALRNGDRLLVPFVLVQFAGLIIGDAGSRYLLCMLPALFLFFTLGLLSIIKWLGSRTEKYFNKKRIVIGFLVSLAVLNIGHNIISIIQCRTALEANGAQSERSLPYFVASRWLKNNAPDAKILTTRTRTIHYLSGCKTIPLRRSGVGFHKAVVDSDTQIRFLLETYSPEYLFTDAKVGDANIKAINAIKSQGLSLEEITDVSVNPRYKLYRLKTQPSNGAKNQ